MLQAVCVCVGLDEGAYVNVNTGSIENNTDQNLYANVGESATSDTQKPPEVVLMNFTMYMKPENFHCMAQWYYGFYHCQSRMGQYT